MLDFLRDPALGGIGTLVGILGGIVGIWTTFRQRSSSSSVTPNSDGTPTVPTSPSIWRGIVAIATIISLIFALVSFQSLMTGKSVHDSTATIQAQATAKTVADNPSPSYLVGSGTLAFVDPLSREDEWRASPTNSTGGACQFVGGVYHVSQQQSPSFKHCRSNGTWSNFALEVQMTIIQGDCGGMTFREESGGQHYYYFHLCQNGTFQVIRFESNSSSGARTLYEGSSTAIHIGLGQQNTLAVVANGSTMTFYANRQQIDQEQDGSYSSGSIALIANPGEGNTTDVAYTNARLWTL